MALVTRDGDNKISVLSIDGTKVEYTRRDINAGLRPYGIDVSSKGDFAAVANIGLGQGDTDTVSLIDVRARPPRVVETVSVGQTPEGIKVSPDGRHVAVVVMNGSNKAKESPFYADHGKLVVLRAKGMKLTKVAEAPIGHWSQGAAFSPDGRTILVGNMVEKEGLRVGRQRVEADREAQGQRRLIRRTDRGQVARARSFSAVSSSRRRRRRGRLGQAGAADLLVRGALITPLTSTRLIVA